MAEKKKFYRHIAAAFMRGVAFTAQKLPRRLALVLGEQLGKVVFHLNKKDRRRALANLNSALGGKLPQRRINEIAKECFVTMGRSGIETLRGTGRDSKELELLISGDSLSSLRDALARGKGLIALTSHTGSWEVLGAHLAANLGKPIYGVARRLYFKAYNDLLISLREAVGVETLFQDMGARPVLRAFKKNKCVVILGDQDIAHLDGVFVDFFGRKALTPTGPASLARASGAAMIPIALVWSGYRHRLVVGKEVEIIKTDDKAHDEFVNTQNWTNATEKIIARYPEQWVWFHRRWRTRPPEEAKQKS